ncbi:MAG TPA: YoaK family protein [Pseudonocardiaceae bacterium]
MNGNRHPQRGVPLIVLAAALAFASGAMDIAAFTHLGQVFCSVMTGNLVLLGLATAHASGDMAVHTAVAFAGYIAGAALGSRIGGRTPRKDVLWPAPVTATLVVELLAFAGFTVGWELTGNHPAGAWQLGVLAVAALAMGLQSAAMRNVGTTLSTTYLTGTLTSAVDSLVTHKQPRRRNSLNVTVLVALAAGAAAGGALLAALPAAFPILPMSALAGVVTMATTLGARQ